MPTILITGAGRGLGAELACQYQADGWRVIATARNLESLDKCAGYQCERLDVDDPASVQALADSLEGISIDILLNNAGINRSLKAKFGSFVYENWLEEYRVNTLAPLRVSEALVEHVARSKRKQIVFISSKTGSNELNITGGSPGYRASKAALNSAVRSIAVELAPLGITCVLMHPGWVRTDMGGTGADLDIKTSVQSVRKIIDRFTHGDNGRFVNLDGSEIPW